MADDASWLAEWPEQYRPVLQLVAEEFELEGLVCTKTLTGKSGAETYLATPNAAAGRANRLILKCGLADSLATEEVGVRQAQTFFQNAHHTIVVMQAAGYRCIAQLLAGGAGAQTFGEFYKNALDGDVVAKVIDKCFTVVLRRRNLTGKLVQQSVYALHQLRDPRRMSRRLQDIGDPPATLADWWMNAQRACSEPSATCLSHGDLNHGNMLVAADEPFAIDFGQTGQHHVMRDLAKLEREIRLFLYPHGSDEREAKAVFDAIDQANSPAADAPELAKAWKAIQVIRRLARELCPSDLSFADEYEAALLAQFMFGAAMPEQRSDLRRIALNYAHELRKRLESRHPELRLLPEEVRNARREAMLWKLAYAYLRVDQLASGGWSRSLSAWMEALWKGDRGRIQRNPEMRSSGGTDFTVIGFSRYLAFLSAVLDGAALAERSAENAVPARMRHNVEARIGFEGGVGVGTGGRAEMPVRIRHTLMAVIAFLSYEKAHNYALRAAEPLGQTAEYLIRHLPHWQMDQSYPFGTYAAAAKVLDLIDDPARADSLDPETRNSLKAALNGAVKAMRPRLLEPFQCTAAPEGTLGGELPQHFFRPYGNFWRMQFTGFLMYLPLLIKEDGTTSPLFAGLEERCRQCLADLLKTVTPYNADNPSASLARYHVAAPEHAGAQPKPPKDWGLSAQLAAVLEIPAIVNLMSGQPNLDVDQKRKSLLSALAHTFDGYHTHPEIFRYTHGVSFAAYLALVNVESVSPEELTDLDGAIRIACAHGLTEHALRELVEGLAKQAQLDRAYCDTDAILDMLVDRLESGEHTPDGWLCENEWWSDEVDRCIRGSTIKFYDSEGGLQYAKRYKSKPIGSFVTRISGIAGWSSVEGLTALDVGCGPGQYAKLMRDAGFEVELLDASVQMLRLASELLGVPVPPTRDMYKIGDDFREGQFDVVFACATLIHVRQSKAADMYRNFFRVLKPGGCLFVSFKISDHSLISRDGRFFEYYRDTTVPSEMLSLAGFTIEEIVLRRNAQNMYFNPRQIHWANFYCIKPQTLA